MNTPAANDERLAPAIRDDLVYSAPPEKDTAIIKDPVTSRYFSLSRDELRLFQLFDGQGTLDQIRARFTLMTGKEIRPEQINTFLDWIQQAGLIAGTAPSRGASAFNGGSRLRNVLYWRVRTINPTRLINFLSRFTAPFFTPHFFALALATALCGLWIAISNAAPIGRSARTAGVDVWLLAFSLCLIIAFVHELAHALTCRYWGGEVKEIGFLIIYLNPALYCDVSDAWLFQDRRSRLWTMAAGAVIESFIWGLMVVGWRLTLPTNPVHPFLAAAAAITGIKLVANANPLLKLDGYYFLSDLLNAPNLRRKSFRYVARLARSVASGNRPAASRREAVTYIAYCVLAFPFSVWLAVTMFSRAARALLSHHLTVAGVALLVVLVFAVCDPILRTFALFRTRAKLNTASQTALGERQC